jgi:hypothetical protein
MITLASAVFLVVMAIVAAVYSAIGVRATPPNVTDMDRDKYVRPFYLVESFYRDCLINLSIAGVSVALSAGIPQGGSQFWDWGNPLLYLGLIFLAGLIVSVVLHDDQELVFSGPPLRRTLLMSLVVVVLFCGSVACVHSAQNQCAGSIPPKSASDQPRPAQTQP